MNELQFWSEKDNKVTQGFRTILVTESDHPYVGRWWPPGHIIGYEHTLFHAVADFLDAITKKKAIRPDFSDGVREMEILAAGLDPRRRGAGFSYAANPGRTL